MTEHPFTKFCDQAACSPDTPMTDAELLARWRKRTGLRLSVSAVTKMREDFWRHMQDAPGVNLGSFRL